MYSGCGDGVQGFRREILTVHSKQWSPCCLPYDTAVALNVFIGYLAFYSTEKWLREKKKNSKASIAVAEFLG